MIDKSILPAHWEVKKLGEVCDKVEKVRRKEKKHNEELLYLDIGGIDNHSNKIVGYKNYTWESAPSRAQQIVYKGDTLFSTVRTYLKNIAYVDKEIYNGQIASSGFCVIRGKKNVLDPKFLFFLSLSHNFLQPLNELQTGSSYPAVRDKDVFSQSIAFPPLSEQQEIVAKIEELFSELDKGKEQLETARQQLKVYRQAVLKWAFEGRFTNSEVKDGELPEGWKWVKLGSIASKITDGEHATPKRTPDGILLLSARNIQNGYLELKKVDYVPEEEYERIIKRCHPEEGDILISCSGSIGRVCKVPPNLKFVMVRSVALIKLKKGKHDSKFFEYLFQSPNLQKQIEKGKKATAQANLFLGPIKDLDVIECSIEEQNLIVQEIESRLSVCDKVEETISQSLQKAVTLRQSILKQAFEGKLVKAEGTTVEEQVNQLKNTVAQAGQYQISFEE